MVGFKVGQKVVYPNHGIGTIEQIEQKQIGAASLPFYTLRLAATNSIVLVEVADVLKNLTFLSHLKPLSFREQRMLERARYLVISELAAVCRQPECNIEP